MEHTKHIWRAGLLLLVCLLGAIVARHFMIPESFGREGFYRYNSLAEFMVLPMVHGGPKSCAECHEDQQDDRDDGPHAVVSCAECHAPVSVHAKDGEKTAEMPSNRSHLLCARCHQKLRARAETMPQINNREHLESLGVLEPGEAIPNRACLVCHNPHTTKEPQ